MYVRVKKSKKKSMWEKDYIWNPATYSYENGRYAESIISNSVVMYNKIIETAKSTIAKTVPAKRVSKKKGMWEKDYIWNHAT